MRIHLHTWKQVFLDMPFLNYEIMTEMIWCIYSHWCFKKHNGYDAPCVLHQFGESSYSWLYCSLLSHWSSCFYEKASGQLWRNYEEVKLWLLNLDLHRSSVHLPAAAVRQCVGVGVCRPGGGGGLPPAAPLRQRGQDHDSVSLLLDGVLLSAGTGVRGDT